MSRPDIAARLAGAVWGHLVGDAVGVPYEFRAAADIGVVEFGATGQWGKPPGTWSDDGSLMLAQLESLLGAGVDPDDFGRRALAWYRRGAFTPYFEGHFDIGGTTREALDAIGAGVPAESAGSTDEHACGNGSLMRILPLALVERECDDGALVDHAHRLSAVTHGHPRVQAACALYVLVARRLLHGSSRLDAIAGARRTLRAVYSARPDRSIRLPALDHLEAWGGRHGRTVVWDSFWSAWHAFAGAETYRETIERAIAYGNDTDTTAAIAGGLAGIRFGIDGIPRDWSGGIRDRQQVARAVDSLVGTTGRLTSTASPLRVDWFDTFYIPLVRHAGGGLGMTFLPGKRGSGIDGTHWRDLDGDVEALAVTHKADVLLLLVEDRELAVLGVPGLPDAVGNAGIELLRFPIRDGGVPADRNAFRRTLDGVIARLLAGRRVVVCCRGGLGRTGVATACIVRELSWDDGDLAIEGVRIYRHGTVETAAQEAFIREWVWPRRRSIREALTRRKRQVAADNAARFAEMSEDEIAYERLAVHLRRSLREEDLKGAYLIRPTSRRPARVVCSLIEPRDPDRLAQKVRRVARRYFAPGDFAVETQPPEDYGGSLWRVYPAPADRLGQ